MTFASKLSELLVGFPGQWKVIFAGSNYVETPTDDAVLSLPKERASGSFLVAAAGNARITTTVSLVRQLPYYVPFAALNVETKGRRFPPKFVGAGNRFL